MKSNQSLKLLFILFIFAGGAAAVRAQNNFAYEAYKARTVSEIITVNADLKNADVVFGKKDAPQMVLYSDFLNSEARVKFMNKSRPISAARKELIKFWRTTFGIDEKVAALFEDEYLFRECGIDYWIPVQKQVAAYFPKELKEGDTISLYLIRGGGVRVGNVWEWVFLVNEFEKY